MEETIMAPRGGNKTGRLYQMINRVRAAIRDFDPSYKLKKRGWICAKEWKEILSEPFDWIWGRGYTSMAKQLPEDKIQVLRSAAKDAVKLDGWFQINGHNVDLDVMRYAMHDIDVIGGIKRQKEALDFMKGVSS